jgi:hypothetical protein
MEFLEIVQGDVMKSIFSTETLEAMYFQKSGDAAPATAPSPSALFSRTVDKIISINSNL